MECEIVKWYREDIHTARKKHRCEECRRIIQPGERYVACTGCTSDGVYVAKQHMRCFHFARHVNHEIGLGLDFDSCIPFGEIESELDQMVHDGDSRAEELLYQWWFIKRGAEFKPVPGGKMEKQFKEWHAGKPL